MPKKADRAIVVVGEEHAQSKSMEAQLEEAVEGAPRAEQDLLPSSASPRLDLVRLLEIESTKQNFVVDLLDVPWEAQLQPSHATGTNPAKLLMTPMRDANVRAPALRGIHRRVGW